MELFGSYDVVVAGAGITGVVAAVAAARSGARTLLVEGSGVVGGLVTGGRLTKPTGVVNGGIFRELIDRAAGYGGADAATRKTYWGAYTGTFDAEVMQRVILETIAESGAEVLLFAQIVDVVQDAGRVAGLRIRTKSGEKLILAGSTVDASGDGDVAVLAGARFMLGRPEDGLTQPITSYFRLVNVDFPAFAADCAAHPDDMWELHLPDRGGARNEDYVLRFNMTGFVERIRYAQSDGFAWTVPKDHLTIRAGLIPGEVNVNATRVHGNALDDRVRSRAAIEIRRQAYVTFDFLKRYVRGFENAIFLDVAPVVGVRETRRIAGDYVLTEGDVKGEARFADAIGLCNAPIDIHEPGGDKGVMIGVGSGYGIPYRCMLPAGVRGLLVAGRCISVDAVAFGSTRNTPACALTGEAAGYAATIAAARAVEPRDVPLAEIQAALRGNGVLLGVPDDDAVLVPA
ncbi:MAG TPA: FAD-dependent oxidoreductase [Candidatus Limnocylindria bacterium]|jgi:hypothetical protein|nr:FAD-dependent oxidoreductase [Candidatus Limnocylindria bacterium]